MEKQEYNFLKERVIQLLVSLKSFGVELSKSIGPELWNAFIAEFKFDEALVTMRIIVKENEVEITNMTTMPLEQIGKGYGTKAVGQIIEWASRNNLEIKAVQISEKESENFWKKNGFVPDSKTNSSNDFVYKGNLENKKTN